MSSTREEITVRVQDALRTANDPVGQRVRVHADGVHLTGAPNPYWYVPVLIDPAEREMYRIYQVLSDVEESLATEGSDRVFLVPAALEFNLGSGRKEAG